MSNDAELILAAAERTAHYCRQQRTGDYDPDRIWNTVAEAFDVFVRECKIMLEVNARD